MGQPLWKTVWQFLNKINTELSWDPAIPLLSIREWKILTQTKICTQMYTVSLFKVPKSGNNPNIHQSNNKHHVARPHSRIVFSNEKEFFHVT